MSKVIHSTHRSQRGFTLTEILVTTAIFAIIMIAALAVYDRSNQTFKQGTESADLQQSTRIGFDKLVSDVRMAGFDYSRGGIPTESWQAPQPDEQIEYAGSTALVFRANFNYNSSSANGNGLEPTYTPVNVQGQGIFPYVTTSNSEIIAYVLRSANPNANNGSISFFADTYQPRAAFPSTMTPAPAAANPSHPERLVTIDHIDVTNGNPPYTLYRVTVADVLAGSLGTPVAENIRSLNFQYYTDFSGTTPLTNADTSAITHTRNADGSSLLLTTPNTGAIGGDGQFDPNASGGIGGGTFTDRAQRALISAIRVSLVGMNANPDLQGYNNAAENLPQFKSYRQYALSSIIVPRNLGLTGFPEPSYNPPSPPTITGICTGFCGAPVIYWQPPSTGNVIKYHIEWDSNANGAFPPNQGFDVNDPTATSAVFLDDGTSDVSLPRYYRMEAVNDNGQSAPSQVMQAIPLNSTKPMPPTIGNVTGGTNAITLTWTAPTQNASGSDVLACSGTGGSTSGTAIPTQELIEFRVYRGTLPNFNPATQGVLVLDYNNPAGQQIPVSPGAPITWVDSPGTSLSPPANCINYYYRVQAIDRCAFTVGGHSQNTPTSQGSISDFSPAVANAAAGPAQSTTTITPSTPAGLLIDHAACSGSATVTLGTPNGTCGPMGSGIPNMYWYIGLQWPKVTTDTSGHTTAIDTYRVTRSRRPQSTGGPFVLDPTWTPTDVSGFSQTSGGTCYWQDRNSNSLPGVPYADPAIGPYEYQYTVAAKSCLIYSAESNTAIFPGCATAVVISPVGTLGTGSGTGDTPASPWVMDASNAIDVAGAVGVTLNSVRFDLYTYPAGILANSGTVGAPGPFDYPWVDAASGSVFQLWMTITDSNNCTEVHLKYIQQEAQAGCVFANVAGVPSVLSGHPSSDEKDGLTYTIINTDVLGGDDLRFNLLSGVGSPFQSSAGIKWSSPQAQSFPDLQLDAIVWSWDNTLQGGTSGSVTDTICAFGACPQPGAVNISTLTSAATTATATTSAAHGYTTGTVVRILGATPATYNGMYTITVLNATQFTYTFAGGTSPATGTMGVSKVLTLNRSVPATLPDIKANGGKLTIRLQFEFDGRHVNSLNQTPPLPNTPVLKFCMPYKINGDLTRTQNCNVVGQNVAPLTTANPASCD